MDHATDPDPYTSRGRQLRPRFASPSHAPDNYAQIPPPSATRFAERVPLGRLGRDAEASFHRNVAIALLASIIHTGDGRAFDSAWTVFRVKEEYEVLKARGYLVEQQSLTTHNGHTFDVLHARAVKGDTQVDWYFDVTELFAERRRRFHS